MDRLGIDKVQRILLAGAFGSHIDPKYAMLLGMIPDCPHGSDEFPNLSRSVKWPTKKTTAPGEKEKTRISRRQQRKLKLGNYPARTA